MIREPGTLVLLLIATFATFLLWRRARRQRIEAESHAAAGGTGEAEPVRYVLERASATGDFVLRDDAGRALSPADADWEAHGLAVVTVRCTDSRFPPMRPGTDVWLEAIADGAEDGVRVVSENGDRLLGDVVRGDIGFVRDALEHGDVLRAVLLDAAAPGATVRVLLIGWGVDVSIREE